MIDTFSDGDDPIGPDEVERLRALKLDRASVRDVISADALDRVWKRLLSRLRKPRFQDFVLYRDALEWAFPEWTWESQRERIRSAVFQGSYRPTPAEEIRTGKSKGLTRSFAYLNL